MKSITPRLPLPLEKKKNRTGCFEGDKNLKHRDGWVSVLHSYGQRESVLIESSGSWSSDINEHPLRNEVIGVEMLELFPV
jgi:hypothetical protein